MHMSHNIKYLCVALDGIIEGLIQDKRDKQGEAEFVSLHYAIFPLYLVYYLVKDNH